MTQTQKRILIKAILNYISENIKSKNQKLAKENLHNQQEKFDRGDMFFKLAFMTDKKVEKIARLILR